MIHQRGNFLLQALLALAMVVAFMPMFANKVAMREQNAKMAATVQQVESVQAAARLYVLENAINIKYGTTSLEGDKIADNLEPYGLMLGFVPRTAMGFNLKLVFDKNEDGVAAYIEMPAGKLSELQRAELARRIGLHASVSEGTVYAVVPLDEDFSILVRRKEPNPAAASFLSDLDLGGFSIENASGIFAANSELESLQTNYLTVTGIEADRKTRNAIEHFKVDRATFQATDGESALMLSRGTMNAGNVYTRSIAKFGDGAQIAVGSASVYDFAMNAGRTAFTGPAQWNINGNIVSHNISFTVERLDISSYINASRGQDVFIQEDTLDFAAKSGIEAEVLRAGHITLRDQTSSALAAGGTGKVILDIRLGGTSILPDINLEGIKNDTFSIIRQHNDDSGDMTSCKNVISNLGASYDANSLTQNIVCSYVFWQRLERRIELKKCLLEGKSGCQ